MDESLQVSGKSGCGERRTRTHLLIVRLTEGNDVRVWDQNATARYFACAGLRFALEQGLDLGRNDGSAEHAGGHVACGGFEAALDPVYETHLIAHLPHHSHGSHRYPCVA